MIFVIEDYEGTQLMSFRADVKEFSGGITKMIDCDVADLDGDYLHGTNETLIRIQSTKM